MVLPKACTDNKPKTVCCLLTCVFYMCVFLKHFWPSSFWKYDTQTKTGVCNILQTFCTQVAWTHNLICWLTHSKHSSWLVWTKLRLSSLKWGPPILVKVIGITAPTGNLVWAEFPININEIFDQSCSFCEKIEETNFNFNCRTQY